MHQAYFTQKKTDEGTPFLGTAMPQSFLKAQTQGTPQSPGNSTDKPKPLLGNPFHSSNPYVLSFGFLKDALRDRAFAKAVIQVASLLKEAKTRGEIESDLSLFADPQKLMRDIGSLAQKPEYTQVFQQFTDAYRSKLEERGLAGSGVGTGHGQTGHKEGCIHATPCSSTFQDGLLNIIKRIIRPSGSTPTKSPPKTETAEAEKSYKKASSISSKCSSKNGSRLKSKRSDARSDSAISSASLKQQKVPKNIEHTHINKHHVADVSGDGPNITKEVHNCVAVDDGLIELINSLPPKCAKRVSAEVDLTSETSRQKSIHSLQSETKKSNSFHGSIEDSNDDDDDLPVIPRDVFHKRLKEVVLESQMELKNSFMQSKIDGKHSSKISTRNIQKPPADVIQKEVIKCLTEHTYRHREHLLTPEPNPEKEKVTKDYNSKLNLMKNKRDALVKDLPSSYHCSSAKKSSTSSASEKSKVVSSSKTSSQLDGKQPKVLWAVTKINIYPDNSRTYEVMKLSSRKPSKIPKRTDSVFVFVPKEQ